MIGQPSATLPGDQLLNGRQARTRKQRDLARALDHVNGLVSESSEVKNVYGNLCHSLPVLVRTNGLCQTVAFVQQKANGSGDQARAYQALSQHIAEVLEITPKEALLAKVGASNVGAYIEYTRRVLAAWIFYKRFAVSILGVTAGTDEGTR